MGDEVFMVAALLIGDDGAAAEHVAVAVAADLCPAVDHRIVLGAHADEVAAVRSGQVVPVAVVQGDRRFVEVHLVVLGRAQIDHHVPLRGTVARVSQ